MNISTGNCAETTPNYSDGLDIQAFKNSLIFVEDVDGSHFSGKFPAEFANIKKRAKAIFALALF